MQQFWQEEYVFMNMMPRETASGKIGENAGLRPAATFGEIHLRNGMCQSLFELHRGIK